MSVAGQTYGGPEESSPPIWESSDEPDRAVRLRQIAVLCLRAAALSPESDDAMRAFAKRRAADLVLAGYRFRQVPAHGRALRRRTA
jgi:hypothetical protein